MNWNMPASAMTAREFLLVATVQGLTSALSYGPGVIVNGTEIAEDALHIVQEVERLTKDLTP